MNVTNIIAGAFAVQGCSLDAKVSAASTPNIVSGETEVAGTPSSDAKDSAEYDTSNLGNLGFIKIDNDSVKYVHNLFGVWDKSGTYTSRHLLIVIKNNESVNPLIDLCIVEYYDNTDNDLKIEKVEIEHRGLTYTYDSSVPEDQQYIAGAQKQFDAYLSKILVRKEELRQETLAKKKEVGQEVLLEGQH